jgi:hypothetical protein
MAIALPAAYHYAYPSTQELVSATRAGSAPEGVELQNLLKMSRGLSFILLAVYAAFLCFQLYSGSCSIHLTRVRRVTPYSFSVPGVYETRHFKSKQWLIPYQLMRTCSASRVKGRHTPSPAQLPATSASSPFLTGWGLLPTRHRPARARVLRRAEVVDSI